MEKSEPRQTTTIRVPPALWVAVKLKATQQKRPASDLVIEALTRYLELEQSHAA